MISEKSDDRIQWNAQLMADAGEEIVLVFARQLQLDDALRERPRASETSREWAR